MASTPKPHPDHWHPFEPPPGSIFYKEPTPVYNLGLWLGQVIDPAVHRWGWFADGMRRRLVDLRLGFARGRGRATMARLSGTERRAA